MTAARRWLYIMVTCLLTCVALVIGVVFWWIDVETFKPRIVAAVQDATGRPLVIHGKMDLELFPRLAIRATGLEMGNAPGFDGPFLTLRELDLQVRLRPLLAGWLEVEAVDMNGLELRLTTSEDGRNNWDDLTDAQEPEAALAAPTPASANISTTADPTGSPMASLIVHGLELTDARVVWTDHSRNSSTTLEDARLDISGFSLNTPFDINSGGRLTWSDHDVRAGFDLSAQAVMHGDGFSMYNLASGLLLSGPDLRGEQETVSLAIGELSSNGMIRNVRLQGLGLDVVADTTVDNREVTGRLQAMEFSLRDFLVRIGRPMAALAHPEALDKVALSLDWSMSDRRLDVSRLDLRVDQSTLQGTVGLSLADRPLVEFALNIDTLDTDHYLPTPDESVSTLPAVRPASFGDSDPWFEPLRRLGVSGTLGVQSMTASRVRLSDVQLTVDGRDGRLDVPDLRAKAYGGAITARASMDVRGRIPGYSWSHELTGVQLGPLLRDVHGQDSVSGAASSVVAVRAAGMDVPALKQSLGGTVRFRIVDGALHGINIPAMLRDEIRKLKGQSAGSGDSLLTRFSELSGTSTITNGVEVTRNLLLLAPRFRMDGAGQADLVRETLNYDVVISLQGTQGRFEESMPGLSRIPLRITGSFAEPVVSVDTPALLRGLGAQGGRAVQDTLRGLGSGINQGAQGLMRGLRR